jgi:hypothetical protein
MKWFLSSVVVVSVGVAVLYSYGVRTNEGVEELKANGLMEALTSGIDPKNAWYTIDGIDVLLQDGVAEIEGTDEIKKSTIRFEKEALRADMNGDGTEDVAVLMTRTTDVGVQEWYLAVAVLDEIGYIGSHAVGLEGGASARITLAHGVLLVQSSFLNVEPDFATTTPSMYRSVQDRYFYVAGASLYEHGPFEEGVQGMFGAVRKEGDVFVFTECDGNSYTISQNSRGLGVVRAIHTERVFASETSHSHFFIAGEKESGEQDVRSDVAYIQVHFVLGAPLDSSCMQTE